MEERAIGIDLGTSNSVIGVFQSNQVEIAPNSIGDTYTPSVVDILDEGELVGEETMLHKIDENITKNRITEIKRIIGRKFSSLSIQEKEKFNAVLDPKNTDQILIKVKRKEKEIFLSPEIIMSFIFKKLIKSASNFINTNIKRAVITIPAYYDYNQRAAIVEAAKLAGIEVLRIINEPTAAALAYGLGKNTNLKDSLAVSVMKQDNKINRKIVVFDLGGGTFDVSALSFKDNKEFQVIGISGDTHLGGNDFDLKIVDFCIKKFCSESKIDESEIRKDKNIMRRLKIQSEKAKKKLSSAEKATITIYNFYQELNLYVELTRDEFNNICEDLYERIKLALDKVIMEAKVSIEQIDDIVVVGGSSKIPKIKTILIEKFGETKIRDQINPDEAVAIGATWQAHKIISSNQDINIIDITPFTLGVATKSQKPEEQGQGSVMSILIPKNKEIPCRSEERMYKTVEINQNYFDIQVYSGEDRFCKNNELLKKFKIKDLPPGEAGAVSLKIYLEIDKDGILSINADVESIGKKVTEKYSLYEKTHSSSLQSSKKKVKIEGKEKLEEIKEINEFMKEKNKLLKTLDDNEKKYKCLKNLADSCAKLIDIYSGLIEQNESDSLYQKLTDNYRRILKYYSEMIIINNDEKNNEDVINKIKAIINKLINDDIENMINIFDQLKEKKPEKYIHIIIFTADLLYNEGQKILDEGKNYARYYARKFFVKGDKIKSFITKDMKDNMDYNIEKEYNKLEEKYVNKVGQIDAFVKALQRGVKLKDTPYVTGFTKIGDIVNKAMEPENVDLALDIFSEMVDSLSADKKNPTGAEAFCLVNIIKIKFSIKENQSLNDIRTYEGIIDRIEYILERIDIDENSNWYVQYKELVEDIKKKKKELESEKEKNKIKYEKFIAELKDIYKNKKEEKKYKEFIEFILDKYPYVGYDPSKLFLKDMSCEQIIKAIYAKYHPDNYSNRDNNEIYEEIYILLGQMKEELKIK